MMKKEKCKIAGILTLSWLIPVIVMVVGLRLLHVYPFGDRSYLGVDGVHQYLPFFAELWEKLHHGGGLFHSWNGGLGYDFWAVASYYLMCPLNLLVVCVKKTALIEAVTALIICKTGLCGLSMSTALFFGKRNSQTGGRGSLALWASLFGVLYALSNYVIGYHINVMWMDAVIYVPWLTYALKRLVTEQKGMLYSVLLALTISANYYIGIAVCLYAVLLYVADLICYGGVKKSIGRFIGYSLLSGGLCGVILLPAAAQILHTKAAQTVEHFSIQMIGTVPKLLQQMLPQSKAVLTTGDASLANIYCGSFALIGLCLFFVLPSISKRQKLGHLFLFVVLVLSFLISGINLLFHGMHEAYGFPNRHAFLYCYVVLAMGYEAVCHLSFGGKKRWSVGIAFFCLLLFGGEVSVHAIISMKANGTTDRAHLAERMEYVAQQTENETGAFVRRDMEKTVSYNEPMLNGQKCLTIFSSTVSGELVETMHDLGFATRLNQIEYAGATDVTNMLLGISVNMRLQRLSVKNPYSPIRDSDIMVENEQVLPVLYGVLHAPDQVTLTSDDPMENQNRLLMAMCGKTLYETEELALDDDQTYTFTQKPGLHYVVAVSDQTAQDEESGIKEVTIDALSDAEGRSRIYDLSRVEQEEQKQITVDAQKVRVYVGTYKEEQLTGIYQMLKERAKIHKVTVKDGMLSAKVEATEATSMVFAAGAGQGYTVSVDHKKCKSSVALGTFVTFQIPEGTHTVTISYRTPGFYPGLLVSLVCLLLLLVIKYKKKHVKS